MVYWTVPLVERVLTRKLLIVVPEPEVAPVTFPEITVGIQEKLVPGFDEVRDSVKVVLEQMDLLIGVFVTTGLPLI